MANEHSPLLPKTQHGVIASEDSPIREKPRISSRKVAVLVVVCVCVGLLALGSLIQTNFHEDAKASQNILCQPPCQQQSQKGINFLVVGDWGRNGFYNQSLVATQMGRIGEELDIDFVLSVGDNFYETGLAGEDDPSFSSSFTDVYTASSLQTTWYTVLGNHDYMGDVLSQLGDGLVNRDSRWYCKRAFQLNYTSCCRSCADSCRSVDMFFFDTTPFIDEYWSPNTTRKFDWRGLAPREEQLQSQLDDLTIALKSSSATWKFVVGHHTIRSIGSHGDYPELVEKLLPILEKYEVDFYINGHDHNLQHIKRLDSPLHFFTSGGGSKAYSGLQTYTDEQGVQFAYDGQGFLAVALQGYYISFTFYDTSGEVLHSTLVAK